jgi:LysR family transcriptional regulator, pca operon transcriptional activator
MDRRIKFRHLEVFSALARSASLKRAAEQLNLSQPAVSKTLSELEEIVGRVLAERSRAGVRLTPEGELFLQFAEQSTAAVRHGLRSLQGGSAAAGRLHVGVLPSVAASIVPPAAAQFSARNPDTLLELTEGSHLDLTGRLRSGGLDMVVGRLGQPESMVGLTFRQLYTEEVIICARPDSPAAGVTEFRELERFRILYPPRDSAIRPLIARQLIAQGVPLFARRIESASAAFGRALVLSDPNVVWFISAGVVDAELAAGTLVRLGMNTSQTLGAVGIMTRTDDVQSPGARLFARLLDSACQQS